MQEDSYELFTSALPFKLKTTLITLSEIGFPFNRFNGSL